MSSHQSSTVNLKEVKKVKKQATHVKKYDLTVKISEATLYVSKTKFFQMSVFVRVKMDGHEEKKTAS